MSDITPYVVGFLFDESGEEVVLIKKNRPAWQAGLLNGVGGKIELGELPRETMTREFFEETGVLISENNWNLFNIKSGVGYTVYMYHSVAPKSLLNEGCQSLTDEEVAVYKVDEIYPDSLIPGAFERVAKCRELLFGV